MENNVGRAYRDFIYSEFFYMFTHPYYKSREAIFRYYYPKIEQVENKDLPNINLEEVFTLMPHYRETLEELETIRPLFEFLLDLSKELVDFRVVTNKKIWKYLVILHTAHNVEMHIRELKDEGNMVGLNDENLEKNFYLNGMTKLNEKDELDTFNLTYFGRKYVEIISPLIEWEFKGSVNKRGYK